MSASTHDNAAVLNSLIQTCRDGEEGFRVAAKDAAQPGLKTLFNALSNQRREFAEELQSLVRHLGEQPETNCSVAGAIHRRWIDLKAAVAVGDDHSILAECERGEDAAVAEFREALGQEGLAAPVRHQIAEMLAAIKASHDQIRDLRDQSVR